MSSKQAATRNEHLDPAFGPDGKGITWIDNGDAPSGYAKGVTVAPSNKENKLLIAGNSGSDFSVVRLNANGTQDKDFGNNGIVTGKFAPGNGGSQGESITVLQSGEFLLKGFFFKEQDSPPQLGLALFDSKGSPIKEFGNDGVTVVHPLSPSSFKLPAVKQEPKSTPTTSQNGFSLELPDGKLMVMSNHLYSYDDGVGLLIRLERNGALDLTFGDGTGYVIIQCIDHFTTANSLIRLTDGTFAVAGLVYKDETNIGMIALYSAEGKPVASFGDEGFVLLESIGDTSEIFTITQMDNGNILGIGSVRVGVQKGLLVCLDTNGVPVRDFNKGEPVLTPNDFVRLSTQWVSGTVRADRIVTIGTTLGLANTQIIIAKFHLNGELDHKFGNEQGLLRIDLTDKIDIGQSIDIQENQIVAVGFSLPTENGVSSFALRCLG
ncbi:hypothetical protein [Pseudomonas sp. NPDC099000]|uniref:hypothetical protein n=1 Tax=Pseudomonas sp. NPDC099000 TaxID=3364488 RepID=UPI00383AE4A0